MTTSTAGLSGSPSCGSSNKDVGRGEPTVRTAFEADDSDSESSLEGDDAASSNLISVLQREGRAVRLSPGLHLTVIPSHLSPRPPTLETILRRFRKDVVVGVQKETGGSQTGKGVERSRSWNAKEREHSERDEATGEEHWEPRGSGAWQRHQPAFDEEGRACTSL